MTNQQRLEQIQERLEMLKVLNDKLNKIINMMEVKRIDEPNIEFTKANPNANDNQLKSYEVELFQMLDNQRVNKNVK